MQKESMQVHGELTHLDYTSKANNKFPLNITFLHLEIWKQFHVPPEITFLQYTAKINLFLFQHPLIINFIRFKADSDYWKHATQTWEHSVRLVYFLQSISDRFFPLLLKRRPNQRSVLLINMQIKHDRTNRMPQHQKWNMLQLSNLQSYKLTLWSSPPNIRINPLAVTFWFASMK